MRRADDTLLIAKWYIYVVNPGAPEALAQSARRSAPTATARGPTNDALVAPAPLDPDPDVELPLVELLAKDAEVMFPHAMRVSVGASWMTMERPRME